MTNKLYLQLLAIVVALGVNLKAARIEAVSKPYTNAPALLGETLGLELSSDGGWAALTILDDAPETLQFSSDVFLRNLATGEDVLVSRNLAGSRGNNSSTAFAVSADGRFVLFESAANDLVAGDENDASDVFLFDANSQVLTPVSEADGQNANGDSYPLFMSGDGRFVLFESEADNLAPNDTNELSDIFLFDRAAGTNFLVTENFARTGSATGSTVNQSLDASVSADGRFVVFLSSATNLVNETSAGEEQQLYLRDMQTGTTRWLSDHTDTVAARSLSSPVISTNGAYAAFITSAIASQDSTDPNTYIRVIAPNGNTDMLYTAPQAIADAPAHHIVEFSMTPDGRRIVAAVDYAYPPFMAPHSALVLYNNEALTNGLVSLTSTGLPGGLFRSPRISADGRMIIFASNSPELSGSTNQTLQLYRHDLVQGTTELLSTNSLGEVSSQEIIDPEISANGAVVGFSSTTGNLSPSNGQDNHVYFARLNEGGALRELTVPDPRGPTSTGNAGSSLSALLAYPLPEGTFALSPNGRYVVFSSQAGNLAPRDDNDTTDFFVRDLQLGETHLINLDTNRVPAQTPFLDSMSADATKIVWKTKRGASPGMRVIMVYDTRAGVNTPISLDQTNVVQTAYPVLMSGNGRYIMFRGYSGANSGFYLHDLQNHTNVATYSGSFTLGYDQISFGGRYLSRVGGSTRIVDWAAQTTNIFDGALIGSSTDESTFLFLKGGGENSLYLYNMILNSSNVVATNVFYPVLSGDGGTVLYSQRNPDSGIGADASAMFSYDVRTGTRTLLSLGANSVVHLGSRPALTPDGRFIAFVARTQNAEAIDESNLYVYDRTSSRLTLVSTATNGAPANTPISAPWISADGQTIVFDSVSSQFVTNDFNVAPDVFAAYLGHSVRIEANESGIWISWDSTQGGILQRSSSLSGLWTTLDDAQSPYAALDSNQKEQNFFRVIYP